MYFPWFLDCHRPLFIFVQYEIQLTDSQKCYRFVFHHIEHQVCFGFYAKLMKPNVAHCIAVVSGDEFTWHFFNLVTKTLTQINADLMLTVMDCIS